jgi:hypothetical protein
MGPDGAKIRKKFQLGSGVRPAVLSVGRQPLSLASASLLSRAAAQS